MRLALKVRCCLPSARLEGDAARAISSFFYFAGLGTDIGDVSTGRLGCCEAFCFVTPDGQIDRNSFLTEDDFSAVVLRSVPYETNVLILLDCCHSGTIVDVQKDAWSGRTAISMVGCADKKVSAAMGIGGMFTHSILMAMEKLCQDDHYSVGKLYNTAVKENDRVFQGRQSMKLECSTAAAPNQMPWPFVPLKAYESPLRSAKNKNIAVWNSLESGGGGDRDIDIGDYKDVPDDLAQWAQENDIDLGTDYEDEELENGWKPGRKLLDSMGF